MKKQKEERFLQREEKPWLCDVTVIEHNRTAVIMAKTKQEAVQKIKNREWVELGDAEYYTVRKSGKVVLGE